MNTMDTDRIVDDYLRRLEEAAAHLQRARRVELVAQIREHVDAALRQEQAAGQADVRNVLERLGAPEEIVEAAERAPDGDTSRVGKLDLAALIALLVPFIGLVLGPVLVVISRAWSGRDKLLGILLAYLPLLILGLGITAAVRSGEDEALPPGDNQPVGVRESEPTSAAWVLPLAASGLPGALYLGARLRGNRHTSPAVLR